MLIISLLTRKKACLQITSNGLKMLTNLLYFKLKNKKIARKKSVFLRFFSKYVKNRTTP